MKWKRKKPQLPTGKIGFGDAVKAVSDMGRGGRRAQRLAMKERNKYRKRHAFGLFVVLPFDAILWAVLDARLFVPYCRVTRLVFALPRVNDLLMDIERSQTLPFAASRGVRVAFFFFVVSHILGCLLFKYALLPDAVYYSESPWVLGSERDLGDTVPGFATYIRSLYWSMQTLTTAGHADVVDEKSKTAANWEILVAMLTIILGNLTFIYVSSNITALVLRLQTRLEQYRFKLKGVDKYLSRNRVSKEVRKRVKRFFRRSLDHDDNDDQKLIGEMPGNLRREVLQDIYMRTLRRVPLFFRVDRDALVQICSSLRRSTFLPDEIICRQGEVGPSASPLRPDVVSPHTHLSRARNEIALHAHCMLSSPGRARAPAPRERRGHLRHLPSGGGGGG